PPWEWNVAAHVLTRRSMLFLNLRQLFGTEGLRQSDQRWPDSPMNQRDLAVDEATHENVRRLTEPIENSENRVAPGGSPPATLDGPARYRLDQSWRRSFSRHENDPVLHQQGTGRVKGRLAEAAHHPRTSHVPVA